MDVAAVYMKICSSNPGGLKSLTRYETAIWRQLTQTMLLLKIIETKRLRVNWPISR